MTDFTLSSPGLVRLLSWAVLPLWWKPLSWWLAYSSWSVVGIVGSLALAFDLFLVFVLLSAFVVILVAPPAVFFRRVRRLALCYLAAALIFIPAFIVGECYLGSLVWWNAVSRFEQRSEPLVRAIHSYQSDHGEPPEGLDELVPDYLQEAPSTGIGTRPRYRYLVGEDATNYDSNPWVLIVNPPCHPMGFDLLLYFPEQNYPDTGYGGWLQRIGDWAYVHE